MATAAVTRSEPVSLYPILTVNFVGTLGFSIVLPFLVFLVTRLGGNAFVYGVMGATYSFFQLIGAPILGRWSDRFGRKRILLLSQLGTLTAWGVFIVALLLPVTSLVDVDSTVFGAFSVTIPLAVLFFARALDGITGGNVSVANAYLADITDDADRSTSFGKMAVSSNLGFVLGPAVAGLLGVTVLGELLPVLAAFAISLIASAIIAFKLPETERCTMAVSPEQATVRRVMGQEQKECYRLAAAPKLSPWDIARVPNVPALLALQFLVFLAFNLFYVAFPVHAVTAIGWSLPEIGVYFSVMGLLMAGVQGPVLARAARRWSDWALAIGGSVVLAVSFLFFGSTRTAPAYAGAALLALGNGVMWPSLLAILSRATDRSMQGAVQGFASSAAAIASIAGMLIGGVLYGLFAARIFVLAAVITGMVTVLSIAIARRA